MATKDLRNMAAACRQYRSTAYQQGGLYIYVGEAASLPPSQHSVQRMARCRDIVRHVVQHGLRVELGFHCQHFDMNPLVALMPRYATAPERRWVADMLASISDALPVLVKLTVAVPEHLRAQLDAALRHPAPHLRMCTLSAIFDIRLRCAPPPPANIFGGSAPKLDKVELDGILPGNVAIPAFTAVRSVVLVYPCFAPRIHIATAFPAVRHLELARGRIYEEPRFRFDLRGLALHKLTICDILEYPILRQIEPPAAEYQIPIVVQDSSSPDWCRDFWPTVPGHLSMRIRVVGEEDDAENTLVTLVSAGRDYTRVFQTADEWGDDDDSQDENGSRVSGLEFLSARFAYIRLDRKYLKTILKFTDGFPVLRRLQIDVFDDSGVFRMEQDSVCSPCPILEDLVVFAMDQRIRIRCDEISVAAKVLGLENRWPSHAVLTLEGVDFADGENPSILASVFPRIIFAPFSGRWTSNDQESGFWES